MVMPAQMHKIIKVRNFPMVVQQFLKLCPIVSTAVLYQPPLPVKLFALPAVWQERKPS